MTVYYIFIWKAIFKYIYETVLTKFKANVFVKLPVFLNV